jgi:hypothetical protein
VEIAAQPAPGTTTGNFLPPPPAPDPRFVPPAGFVPDNTMDFRGVLPRTSELVALPIALGDLSKFADYTEVMGSKAPSIDQVQESFAVTNQWSSARTTADAWDKYARTQEGVAWSLLRAILARMGPAFQLAVESDPSLAATYPGLTTLLGAKKAIAHKGVATKKANKKNVAEGKAPTHGKVGKKATKAAQKAALVAQEAAETAANGVQAAAPVTQQNGATSASAAAGPAPTASVAPATATNGAGNTGH